MILLKKYNNMLFLKIVMNGCKLERESVPKKEKIKKKKKMYDLKKKEKLKVWYG